MTHRPWMRYAFQPLVISGMIGCIAVALVKLAHLINPSWSGTYLVAVCVLAALEACYSHWLLKKMAAVDRSVVKFRLTELALFLILIKIGSYVGASWNTILADIQTWSTRPMNIFGNQVLVAFVLAFASWVATTDTMGDLERLDDPPEYHRDQVAPAQSITIRFFTGGILLVIITGLSRLTIEALLDLSRPSVPGLVLNVLIYFLLGLVLLGQVQYTTMHRRWHAREVKVTEKITGRWVRYSLIFISLVSLVAFLIPTGYTMGLLETAGNVLAILAAILRFIVNLIVFLVSLPIWLLMQLFGQDGTEPPIPPVPLTKVEEPQVTPAVGAPPWFDVLRSFVFWIVALGIVFYVIRSYLRDHPQVREALSSLWLIRVIHGFLTALWRSLTGMAKAVGARIPRRLALRRRERAPHEPAFRFFRLGALSPRERTLYYYLSILQRAGQQGFRRKDSQTPYEYDAVLEPNLPQAQQEMGLLTDDFVEARYSPHAIDHEREREVHTRWKRVKTALRTLKKRKESG